MVAISKYDMKVWKDYISNFEETILLRQNESLKNVKRSNDKIIFKDEKTLSRSKRLNKKKIKPETILDLHGHTLNSAKLLLHKFIYNCYEKNVRIILIITGKGQNNTGVLKQEVPKWLNDKFLNKYIVNIDIAPKNFGGEGALLVRIKNRYKKFNL